MFVFAVCGREGVGGGDPVCLEFAPYQLVFPASITKESTGLSLQLGNMTGHEPSPPAGDADSWK